MNTKADRLISQAIRLHGMTRRQATEWAFAQLVNDAETAARNANLVPTYHSKTLGYAVTVPA